MTDLGKNELEYLYNLRTKVAEMGYELTLPQLVDQLKEIDGVFREHLGYGLAHAKALMGMEKLESPPYEGYFDDWGEADQFRQRAEALHGVRLEVVRFSVSTWGRSYYKLRWIHG